MNPFKTLFDRLGVQPGAGVPPERLRVVEEGMGAPMPAGLRDFYGVCNGLSIGQEMTLLPLPHFDRFPRPFPACSDLVDFGYFPFTDCNDSNPYCLAFDGPIRGMVVHLFHDDSPCLVSRSFESFIGEIEQALQRPEDEDEESTGLDRLEGELSIERPDRTEEDARIGRELAALAAQIDPRDPERTECLIYAAQLFGPDHIADLVGLLATDGWGDARRRLGFLKTPRSESALRAFDDESAGFITGVAEAIRRVGITVIAQGLFLTVGQAPKVVHLNTPMWIGRRREPGIIDEIVERARQLLAMKR